MPIPTRPVNALGQIDLGELRRLGRDTQAAATVFPGSGCYVSGPFGAAYLAPEAEEADDTSSTTLTVRDTQTPATSIASVQYVTFDYVSGLDVTAGAGVGSAVEVVVSLLPATFTQAGGVSLASQYLGAGTKTISQLCLPVTLGTEAAADPMLYYGTFGSGFSTVTGLKLSRRLGGGTNLLFVGGGLYWDDGFGDSTLFVCSGYILSHQCQRFAGGGSGQNALMYESGRTTAMNAGRDAQYTIATSGFVTAGQGFAVLTGAAFPFTRHDGFTGTMGPGQTATIKGGIITAVS